MLHLYYPTTFYKCINVKCTQFLVYSCYNFKILHSPIIFNFCTVLFFSSIFLLTLKCSSFFTFSHLPVKSRPLFLFNYQQNTLSSLNSSIFTLFSLFSQNYYTENIALNVLIFNILSLIFAKVNSLRIAYFSSS